MAGLVRGSIIIGFSSGFTTPAYAIALHDQGFDHGMFRHVEFARGYLGAAMLLVLIAMLGMGHAVILQEQGRRRFRGRAWTIGDRVSWFRF